MTGDIQIVTPFPLEHVDMAFGWLREYPQRNFHDYTPATPKDLGKAFEWALSAGEQIWEVVHLGQPVGVVRFVKTATEIWSFNGICFTESVHGSGVPLEAGKRALRFMFANGASKVRAGFFYDNRRVAQFLKKLGAVYEGYLTADARRMGKPTDVILVAIHGDAFFKMHGSCDDQISTGAPKVVPASA